MIAFWLIFAAAIFSRLFYINLSLTSVSEDAAMVGLAALHWFQGSDFPLISYGQAYLGTLEAIVAAGLFKVLGYGMLGLTLAPFLFGLAFVVVVYFFGKDMGGKRFGLTAMAFAAIPSPFLANWSVAVKGGYPETLFFGTLLLWLAWRWKDKRFFWLGIVGGLAWWCHPLSIYYLAAAGLYLWGFSLKHFSIKRIFKESIFGVFGFLVGSFPFWLFNFQNHFLSFAGGSGFRWHQIHIGLWNAFTFAGPSTFCFKPIADGIIAMILAGGVALLLALSLGFLWRRSLFILFFTSVLFFYSLNQFGVAGEPRYLMFLYSLLPFSLAWLCEKFRRWGKAAAAVPLLLVLSHNGLAILKDSHIQRTNQIWEGAQVKQTLQFLKENLLARVVSPNGPRYSVTTQEEIVGAEPWDARFPKHELIADAADRVALEGRTAAPVNPPLDATLKAAGIRYETFTTQISQVYHSFQAPSEKLEEISPEKWIGFSQWAEETAPAAYDRNLAWSWTTAQLKERGQAYLLDLGQRESVRRVHLYNGFSFSYFPSGLKIETSLDGKKWTEAAAADPFTCVYWAGSRPFWAGYHSRMEIRLDGKPIRYLRFVHLGSSTEYEWKINEIYLYRSAEKAESASEKDFRFLMNFLEANQIQFVYADRGLSAKIILSSDGKIGSCRPYNAKRPYQPETSRKIDFTRQWAIVFENLNSASSEKILDENKILYRKKELGPYTVLFGPPVAEAGQGINLEWSGFSVLRNSREAAPEVKDMPQVPANVIFEGKLGFLGTSIEPSAPAAGETFHIRYFWRALAPIRGDWAVFVHFQNGARNFQNDHSFYHGEFPVREWNLGEIVTETYPVQIPNDFPTGEATISVGIVKINEGKKRAEITRSNAPTKGNRAKAGKLTVSSAAR